MTWRQVVYVVSRVFVAERVTLRQVLHSVIVVCVRVVIVACVVVVGGADDGRIRIAYDVDFVRIERIGCDRR